MWHLGLEIALFDTAAYLGCQQRGHSIADLGELTGGWPQKFEIIRECLESRRFPDAQGSRNLRMQV